LWSMHILFTTNERNRVSSELNIPNYARLCEVEGVKIDFFNRNYADYDVILFMGYDAQVQEARLAKSDLIIGVIDPRPSTISLALGADFIIVNGLESQDVLANYFTNIFVYPIYPMLNLPLKEHKQRKPLIIGYHGNKVHLTAMYPYISTALEELAKHHPIELWAVYDVKKMGELTFPLFESSQIPIRYFQWTREVYEVVIADMDIGIVPHLIPIAQEDQVKMLIESDGRFYNEHVSEILQRFKNTTNPGRLYVFSQLGIPVVAGMVPSAAQVIKDGYSGYLAQSTGGWYRALKNLADSPSLRTLMGQRLYEDFQSTVSITSLNKRLVDYIQNLKPQDELPVEKFLNAGNKIKMLANNHFYGGNPDQEDDKKQVLDIKGLYNLLWHRLRSKI